MTKQTKKLIAIFIAVFAIIEAVGEDCTDDSSEYDKGIVHTDKKSIETYKFWTEYTEAAIEHEKALERYYIDYYKWQETCRKMTLEFNKASHKCLKALLEKSLKLKELEDIINNGATEEIREAAKEEYKRVEAKKLPKAPKAPKLPKEPKIPENTDQIYMRTHNL